VDGSSSKAAPPSVGLAIVEVIASLNRALALRVTPEQLQAADAVLRAVVDDEASRAWAQTIPGPTPPRRPRDLSRTGAFEGRQNHCYVPVRNAGMSRRIHAERDGHFPKERANQRAIKCSATSRGNVPQTLHVYSSERN
jgi:hypothetical protein